MNKNFVKKDFKDMTPFDIEAWVIKAVKGTATQAGTPGVDATRINKNGELEKLEIKVHGKNRCSLGRISMTKTIAENIADLLVADKYINVRPQGTSTDPRPFIIVMNKTEMAEWLQDRVVYDLNRHKQPKFKINFFERSKKQDKKLIEMGFEL